MTDSPLPGAGERYAYSHQGTLLSARLPAQVADIGDISGVLSLAVYNDVLNDEDRKHLERFLPQNLPLRAAESNLERLFAGETYHFSSPLRLLEARLKEGYYRHDTTKRREKALESLVAQNTRDACVYAKRMCDAVSVQRERVIARALLQLPEGERRATRAGLFHEPELADVGARLLPSGKLAFKRPEMEIPLPKPDERKCKARVQALLRHVNRAVDASLASGGDGDADAGPSQDNILGPKFWTEHFANFDDASANGKVDVDLQAMLDERRAERDAEKETRVAKKAKVRRSSTDVDGKGRRGAHVPSGGLVGAWNGVGHGGHLSAHTKRRREEEEERSDGDEPVRKRRDSVERGADVDELVSPAAANGGGPKRRPSRTVGRGARSSSKSLPNIAFSEMGYPSFFSVLRDIFRQLPDARSLSPKIEGQVQRWQASPSFKASGRWRLQFEDWSRLTMSALRYLSGDCEHAVQQAGFTPRIEFKERSQHWRWLFAERGEILKDGSRAIAAENDGEGGEVSERTPVDPELPILCEHWLKTRHDDDNVTGASVLPAPRMTTEFMLRTSTGEERREMQRQERERYENPHLPYTFRLHDYEAIVGPIKGVYSKDAPPPGKARDHPSLVKERPVYVTILTLVRDTVARLPNGEGTRADICMLLRDSQYVISDISDEQISSVVSGALDRLHYEKDPCVRYDNDRKLWVYMHRGRSVEDFARIHKATAIAAKARKSMQQTREKPSSQANAIMPRPTLPAPPRFPAKRRGPGSISDASASSASEE